MVPFKKALFGFVKILGAPPERIYKHLYFKGIFNIRVNGISFKMYHYGYQLENDIFWNGLEGWEKNSLQLWKEICRNSAIIFDIGSNTGIYSLLAKTINKDAKVYAFEPVKRVYDKLLKNISLNQYQIEAFEMAISNYSGKAIIYDPESEHTYTVTVNKNILPDSIKVRPVEITTKTLDDFIRENDIKNIDLIKLDVETHEPEVLEGFSQNISMMKPSILIEILNDEIAVRIEALVKDLGYLYYAIDEEKGIKKVAVLKQSPSYNYLLCQKNIADMLAI